MTGYTDKGKPIRTARAAQPQGFPELWFQHLTQAAHRARVAICHASASFAGK